MRTAEKWQKTPSEWDELSTDDKAEMMAYTEAEGKMQAVEMKKAEDNG